MSTFYSFMKRLKRCWSSHGEVTVMVSFPAFAHKPFLTVLGSISSYLFLSLVKFLCAKETLQWISFIEKESSHRGKFQIKLLIWAFTTKGCVATYNKKTKHLSTNLYIVRDSTPSWPRTLQQNTHTQSQPSYLWISHPWI